MSVKEKAPGYQPGASSYQRYAIHLGIPPRTPQGTRPLTRISGCTRTHPRRRAGKAGDLLSFTERIPREPLGKRAFAAYPRQGSGIPRPVDNGFTPSSVICFLYQWRACCKSAGCVQALWMPFSPYWPQREGRIPVGCDWES